MKKIIYLIFLVNFSISAQIFKPILQFNVIPHSEGIENKIDATDWLIKKIKANEQIPVGNYFISRPIILDSPITINMTGNGFLFEGVHDWKKGISHNNFVTAIMPLGNFNVFEIKSRDVYINNGLVYTGFVEDYTATIVYYDTNNRIIRSKITNLYIDGKWEDLLKTGNGSVAIDFEANIRKDLKSEYGSYFDFSGMNIRFCNTGIQLLKKGKYAIENRLSINSINIDNVKMWGCKKYLNFQWGSNVKATNLQLHDFNVLSKEEFGQYAISAFLTDSDIVYEIYDSSNVFHKQTKDTYRHGKYHIEGNLSKRSNSFKNEFNRR